LRDKTLVLTVVNSHASERQEAEIAVKGASIMSGKARVLTASDIHAHNTFDHLHAVEPEDSEAAARGTAFIYQFQPASVTRLALKLT